MEKAINEELARFLKDGPTPVELQRVQTQYQAGFLRGVERIGGFGGKSDYLAQSAVFIGDPSAYKTMLKRVQTATVDDLRSAANRWLADGAFIADVMPFPELKASTTPADRSKPPALDSTPEPKMPKLQRATLSSGLKIVLVERHNLPLVNLSLMVDAGFAADQSALPGTAKLAGALMTDGTSSRNAFEINDQAALLGASLYAYSNADSSTVGMSALKTKLDPSLNLFADVILHPSFPESDFQREQKLQFDAIEQEESQPVQMALRILPRFLYGANHAYGNPLTGSGTVATVQKITRQDLVKYHQAWFHPNNSTLVIVGDTTLAEITPKLESLFSGWKSGDVPAKNLATVPLASKSTVYLIDKPGAEQSLILAGLVAAPPNTPQELAIQAMNDDLGGEFSSRLNMNIREDKHWSYGVQTLLFGARAQRPFLVYAPVETDKTKESLVELQKELRAIISDRPVTQSELARVTANETLGLPGSLETSSEISGFVRELLRNQWPDNYYDTMPAKIRALTTSDLDAAAKLVIHPDNFTWVIVGDRAKIEAGVRELGLGEIKIIDADGNPK